MLSFNFNGLNSYEDFGIIIAKRPVIPLPKRRVTYTEIPGMNGSLKYDEGTLDDITISVECSLKDKENIAETIDRIKQWLYEAAENELIFSYQEDKKYIAQVVNAIDFEQVYRAIGKFVIVFNCKPFKYFLYNNKVILTQSTDRFINYSTLPSEPIIKVYGSGTIVLTINNEDITLTNVIDYIIIDSTIMDCYKDNELKNNEMIGEFPIFNIGRNSISWVGSVSKIEIIPNFKSL